MTAGEPVKKKLVARRFQHLCPTHGWETCGGYWVDPKAPRAATHACSREKREVPPTEAALFESRVREVFLDGREPLEVQGP